MFDPHHLAALIEIMLFDLLLSGDNAVVIGMASRSLSPVNRQRAIIIGGAGAVGLRIGFTLVASYLLEIPALEALGGVMLLWIAVRLMRPDSHEEHVAEADSLAQAIRTIIIADAVMSLDNILAISGAAEGNQWLVLFGLGLSIPLLLVGSGLVSRMLNRLPILVYVGAALLVWAAVRMIAEDEFVRELYHFEQSHQLGFTMVATCLAILIARRTGRRAIASTA